MPTIYTEAIWRSLYAMPQPWQSGQPKAPVLTYGRDYEYRHDWTWSNGQPAVRRGAVAPRQRKYRDALTGGGLLNNARVIFIGCAFGFLMEDAIDGGITQVWGIEPSPWIWANTSEIRADVLPLIVNATVGVTPVATIQTLLANAGMANPRRGDWIIDEDAISSQQNDTEIAAFLTACEELLQGNAKGRIVHIVTPLSESGVPGDSALLWKTMAEWKAYAPDHTWVDARTMVVA